MFINLIKKSFVDIAKNPIIALFLVFYLIIMGILTTCINIQRTPAIIYLLLFTTFVFIAIFISGWFRVIKEIALKNPEEERTRSYIGMFLESVGENEIPVLIGLVIYFFFSVLFICAGLLLAKTLFGIPQELIYQAQASGDPSAFINNLPDSEKIQIYIPYIFSMISAACCTFVFLYYFPAMIFDRKTNMFLKPFVCLKENFKFLFKNFFMSLGFYLFLCLVNIIFIVGKAFLPTHPVVDIFYIFYVIYFLSYSVMLICNYYGKKYSDDNGGDSLGENESDDSVSKED